MLFASAMLLSSVCIMLEKSAMLQTISASRGGGWGRVSASEGRQCWGIGWVGKERWAGKAGWAGNPLRWEIVPAWG